MVRINGRVRLLRHRRTLRLKRSISSMFLTIINNTNPITNRLQVPTNNGQPLTRTMIMRHLKRASRTHNLTSRITSAKRVLSFTARQRKRSNTLVNKNKYRRNPRVTIGLDLSLLFSNLSQNRSLRLNRIIITVIKRRQLIILKSNIRLRRRRVNVMFARNVRTIFRRHKHRDIVQIHGMSM